MENNPFRISRQVDSIGGSHRRTVQNRVFSNVSSWEQESGGMGTNTKQWELGPVSHFE